MSNTLADRDHSLAYLFVKSSRAMWSQQAATDTTGKSLTHGKALIGATLLSGVIGRMTEGQDKVGVMLPASVGGALVNVAITMLGKVAVNLNFTSGEENVASAIEQCGIETVISARALAVKLQGFTMPEGTVYMEDVVPTISGGARVAAVLKAKFAPIDKLVNEADFESDKLATVIFSSGTTAKPKGVMLSHKNIISNMRSFDSALGFSEDDRMCAALPFFHSFGFTCTLWFPLIRGFAVDYHPNPLEGDTIAGIVRQHGSTVLLATPTFLITYIRRASRDDFASLKYVITGAEKLRTRVAEAFERKFGILPLEGYGVTETSPVISCNLLDDNRKGTIGKVIPEMTVRIVDQDTGEEVPHGEEGLLLVKGPSVMLGYLGKPEMTASVLKNGWYNTGDIAKIIEDDFMVITDRASRFSKIGGEMVPHGAIEETLLDAIETEVRAIVVTSVPDDRKGERLAVLYTTDAGSATDLQDIISKSELPNLWRPNPGDYLQLDDIPVLGSGKLDLRKIKEVAKEKLAR